MRFSFFRTSLCCLLLTSLCTAEEGKPEPDKPPWQGQFSVKPVEPVKTIIAPGETYTTVVQASNPTATPWKETVRFRLLDFEGHRRAEQTVEIDLQPKEEKELKIAFTAPERGLFKVAVGLPEDRQSSWEGDISSFAAWPQPTPKKLHKPTFFRDVISCWEGDGSLLQQAARLGQTWAMGHDMLQATWWSMVQPTPDAFDWKKLGYQVENCRKYGFNVVGEFIFAPPWSSKDPEVAKQATRQGYPMPTVPRLELWRKYVYETVNHYKDAVKCWQVGNEPHVCLFWSGSIEEFATLCQAACEEARKADPGCLVLGSGLGLSYFPWNERFAKAGGFGKFDAVSFHDYISHDPPERIYENLKSGLEHLKGLMRQYPPHRELPIWNTEGGDWTTTWLRGAFPGREVSWRSPAAKLVKHYAVEMSLGVVCHFYYLQNGGGDFGSLIDLDINGAPKPLLMARIAMQEQLDGLDYQDTFRSGEAEGRVWAMLFQQPGRRRTVAVCWAGEGGEIELSADWGRKLKGVANLMGNLSPAPDKLTLTDEPRYLQLACSAETARKLLERAEIKVLKEPSPLPKPVETELKPQLPPVLADYSAPKENPEGNFTVNLRPYCNMGFADEAAGDGKGGWRDEGPLNDMACVEPGRKVFYGVPFDLIDPATNNGKSVITLKGMTLPQFPGRVDVDLKNRTCRTLYLLQASTTGPGLAHFEIKHADGQVTTLPLAAGVNTDNWWFGYRQGEESKPVPFLARNTADGKPAYRYLRVLEWQNPRPKEPVSTVSLVVKEVKEVYQATSLVAISGTNW